MALIRRSKEDKVNKYIRARIYQARTEASRSQDELAKELEKSRVAITDMESGRVSIHADDLTKIAIYFHKPVSFFYPPAVKVEGALSPMEEELLNEFALLPDEQQYIALEYVKQQGDLARKARDRANKDEASKIRAEMKR